MHFFLAYKTIGHTKPCSRNHVLRPKLLDSLPRAILNHVLETTWWDQNYLTHSLFKIISYNPPFKLDLGIPHTPPYHLGLSPDFTGELLGVCMPYQLLQPYALYMQKFPAPLIFLFFFMFLMVTAPSPTVASSSRFSMLVFLFVLCHARLISPWLLVPAYIHVIDVHIKRTHLPDYMGHQPL